MSSADFLYVERTRAELLALNAALRAQTFARIRELDLGHGRPPALGLERTPAAPSPPAASDAGPV